MKNLLQGDRIRIRPIENDDDLKYLFHSFNNPESVGKYVSFEPRSWDAFRNLISEGSRSATHLTIYLIERNEDKKIIGSVAFFVPHPLSKQCLEIGYGIDFPELRQKGLAFEAASLLVDFLFSTKPLERVQATTNIGNIASQKVLEKLGFSREGILRKSDFLQGKYSDVAMYSLLREEWKPR